MLIKTMPEMEGVFGKAGRADSAIDPAPLTMLVIPAVYKRLHRTRQDIS